ncbi:MAG: hypothetical protein KatS3mg052_2669 [Candidatus Roseilinea sp.]|nr:MAG: hypothetical protein KatS3mg052_2669 [Candidatus Roseilinea sp.]
MSHLLDYPMCLRASTEHAEVIYTRAENYHAVKNASSAQAKDAVLTLKDDDDSTYLILKGEPPAPGEEVSAVYQGNGGMLVVPTGRVFVRLNEGARVEAYTDAFRKLGFVIAQSPPYAPHVAWLEREDGDAAAALRSVGALEKLPQVCNVEPQLLTARAWR